MRIENLYDCRRDMVESLPEPGGIDEEVRIGADLKKPVQIDADRRIPSCAHAVAGLCRRAGDRARYGRDENLIGHGTHHVHVTGRDLMPPFPVRRVEEDVHADAGGFYRLAEPE
jgi:hypothetical protein